MLKVTLKFVVIILLGCNPVDKEKELEEYELQLNKEEESIIDAAYVTIQLHCDSLIKQKMAMITDSILAAGKKRKIK